MIPTDDNDVKKLQAASAAAQPAAGAAPLPYVAYGRGFSGDYASYDEAAAVVAQSGQGAVYVRARRRPRREEGN